MTQHTCVSHTDQDTGQSCYSYFHHWCTQAGGTTVSAGDSQEQPSNGSCQQEMFLHFQPILNKVQKFRCWLRITGAIYCASIYNMGSGGLAAELSLLNGSRLEVTAAPLPYSCCQGLPDNAVKCGGMKFLEIIMYTHKYASTQTLYTHSHTHHCPPNIQD